MTTLVTTAVFAALAVYLWRECKPFLDRAMQAKEKTVAIHAETSQPPVPPTPREALPPDIRLICEQWRDPWAREQAMDYYCEAYDQVKSWTIVHNVALSDQARLLKGA